MVLFDILLAAGFLVVFIVFQMWHERRVDTLLNRIMAKDYEQFRYYQEKYKKDLAELERLREEAHKEEARAVDEASTVAQESEKDPLAGFEEDWREPDALRTAKSRTKWAKPGGGPPVMA